MKKRRIRRIIDDDDDDEEPRIKTESGGAGGDDADVVDLTTEDSLESKSRRNNGGGGGGGVSLPPPSKKAKVVDVPPPTHIPLDPSQHLIGEQKQVLELVAEGKSVFVTGSAGTGKSFLLPCIVDALTRMYGKKAVMVTAMTGTAAVNIGGCTLHRACSLWPEVEVMTIEAYEAAVKAGPGDPEEKGKSKDGALASVRRRWRETKAIVIDEVSMCSSEMFDFLDKITKRFTGQIDQDFGGIQVIVSGDLLQLPPVSTRDKPRHPVFTAQAWDRMFVKGVNIRTLQHIHRQKDAPFVRVLQAMRLGIFNDAVRDFIKRIAAASKLERDKPTSITDIRATELFCKRIDVQSLNEAALARLPGVSREFKAKDTWKNEATKKQLNDCNAPYILKLKVGAQVMLLCNKWIDFGLSNGSRGVVIKFSKDEGYPIVRFVGGLELPIPTHTFEFRNGGDLSATRTQFPLMLAWALTVHKVQGATLDKVKLHPEGAFTPGQLFVMFSRARNEPSIELLTDRAGLNFRACPQALGYYKRVGELEAMRAAAGCSLDPMKDIEEVSFSDGEEEGAETKTTSPSSVSAMAMPMPPPNVPPPKPLPLTDVQRRLIADKRMRALQLLARRVPAAMPPPPFPSASASGK